MNTTKSGGGNFMKTWRPRLIMATVIIAFPGMLFAQGLSGEVTDSTGGVLPGVTVEAESDALIEGVRTAVTDGSGRYSIVGLITGDYSVTFTLPGFSVVRREGISLSAGFTANVGAELAVGSLEETVTVTGAAPTVDVVNVRTQQVLDDETLNLLPSAQNVSSFANLTLGAKLSGNAGQGGVDVGGSGGEMGYAVIHGSRGGDMKISQEGLNTNNSMGTNGGILHMGQHYNMEAVAEVQMTFNGMTADTETAGLQINYIPKDGGNTFSASGRANFTNEDFQADNRTDELIARGATTAPKIKRIWDYAGAMGGPINRDTLWFFTAHRSWGSESYAPGSFFNKTQGAKNANGVPLYVRDEARKGFNADPSREHSVRLTWQASSVDKIAYYGNAGRQCLCGRAVGAVLTPAAGLRARAPNNHISQGTYTRAQSSQVLIEAGISWLNNPFGFERLPGVGTNDVTILEVAPVLIYNSAAFGGIPYNSDDPSATDNINARYSLSYVTGSHALKFGGTWQHGWIVQNGSNNHMVGFGPVRVTTYNSTPIGLLLYAHPQYTRSDYRNLAVYAQDQWTINRFTLNIGVRGDFFEGYTPAHTSIASAFTPAFDVPAIKGTPSWKDVSPRLGLAWDVQGNGRTAIKVSAGRYMSAMGTGLPLSMNPATKISKSSSRSWSDANQNFFPEGDPKNPVANGEMGPSSNAAFGTAVVTQFFNDDMMKGSRPYTWQASASLERELTDDMRLAVSYFFTSHFNQTVVDNETLSASDFNTYSVTVPSLATLPGGGGNTISGLANRTAASLANVPHNERKLATNFGKQKETYSGVDIELNTTFGDGGLFRSGVSLGTATNDRCFVVDSPQELYQCKVTTPMNGLAQVKLSGAYPLPYGFEVSGVYQNLPGIPIQASVLFFNSAIAGSLGRNLSSCPAATGACNSTVSVNVLEPNKHYEKRMNQLDFRIAKVFRGAGMRVRVTFDLYNALNNAPILARSNNFGTAGVGWGRPTQIMSGRLIKVGGQFSWN